MPDLPSIEDLLKLRRPSAPSPAVTAPVSSASAKKTHAPSEPTVQEAFSEKMNALQLGALEEKAKREAAEIGLPYVNLQGFAISPEALQLVPKEQAEKMKAVPILFTGPELRVAALAPETQETKDFLHQLTERHRANGSLYKISEQSLAFALKRYDTLPVVQAIVKGVRLTETELGRFQADLKAFGDIQQIISQANVTDFLTIVLAAALKFDSSDVHIEAEETGVVVRYRMDGVLQDVAKVPPESWKKIISRVKLMSGLKLNITEAPQDGRFTIFLNAGDTDVRVSTIPTAFGESVVMRLLRPETIAVEFGALGIRPSALARFEKEIQKPHGMILATGPTGSGKTTTLYAVLKKLNTKDVKIITLEDPIEYKLEGVNQSQIEADKQYTFASGLRSVLRQDPDILLVGEIRDLETADVAINAALTGHLLLSTVHTNNAAGAIPRLLSMGVKPFLLAPALSCIIGQRLVRRVCQACKEFYTPEADILEQVKKQLMAIPPTNGESVPNMDALSFARGKGCPTCHQTGFKGRIGIYEILVVDDPIKKSLSESLSEYDVEKLAIAQGMVSMVQDGFLKAVEGITTPEEVLRVAVA